MHLKLPIGICVGTATVVVGSRRDLVDLALNHFRGRGVGDLEGNLNRSCSHKVVVARAGRKKLWWHQELEEKWWLPDTLVALFKFQVDTTTSQQGWENYELQNLAY